MSHQTDSEIAALAGVVLGLGVGGMMLHNAVWNCWRKRRVLVRHPDTYAVGRDAVIIGVMLALFALIPLGGGILCLLDVAVRLMHHPL